jgi:hypothetical protein
MDRSCCVFDKLALSHSPSNRVQDPKDSREGSADCESTLNIAPVSSSMQARLPDETIYNVEQRETSCNRSARVESLLIGGTNRN